jgi:hypothetical protein
LTPDFSITSDWEIILSSNVMSPSLLNLDQPT